jgi:hypothetical protein
MSSLPFVNGPLITVRFSPEYFMRQPFEVGCSPDASSNTPAFASSSCYIAMAAKNFSSGFLPASESFVVLTAIMNRTVVSPSTCTSNEGTQNRQKVSVFFVPLSPQKCAKRRRQYYGRHSPDQAVTFPVAWVDRMH